MIACAVARDAYSATMARLPKPLAYVVGPPLALLALSAGLGAVYVPSAFLFHLLLWEPHWLISAFCGAALCAPRAAGL